MKTQNEIEMAAHETVKLDEARRMWRIYQDKCAELNDLIDQIKDQDVAVYSAACAVVERWDTPLWKDAPATAKYIKRLRTALSSENVDPISAEINL